jgi:hypothetical protein
MPRMSRDAVLQAFDEAGVESDIPLPGGRPRRKRPDEVQAERHRAETQWDAHPRVYTSNGEDQEYFPISALAMALDRRVVTLYSWERKGWLPDAQFRSPRVDDVPGHRLYTRRFIEGLIKIAKEEGLLTRSQSGAFPPVETTDFPDRAADWMRKCRA